MTEETKISDLIGSHSPSTNKDKESETIDNNIEPIEGFLNKAIRNGNIIILDNLHEANSIITKRLNVLLDSRDSFYILEKPLENIIEINGKLRIIGTSDRNLISKVSSAFLNRFVIINEVKFNDLIKKFLENENDDLSKDIVNEMFPSLGDVDESDKNKELDECVINDIIQSKKEEIEYLRTKLSNLLKNGKTTNDDEEKKLHKIKDETFNEKKLKIAALYMKDIPGWPYFSSFFIYF